MWLAVVIVAGVAASHLNKQLKVGGFSLKGTEFNTSSTILANELRISSDRSAVVVYTSPTLRVTDKAFADAAQGSLARLAKVPYVTKVESFYDPGLPPLVSKDNHTTYAPDHNRGMAEGRWDFTLSSADTMIARTTTDGVDYMLFMQAEEGLSAYLIGQPGVDSIENLRGKLLAGDPGDSNLDLIRKKILRTHGIDDTEYNIEIIGSSPVRLEAFLNRRVAAAMLTPPASDKALAAGGVLLADSENYVPGWPLTCGWTLRHWLLDHRELVVRFIRAWAAATDWLLLPENRDETIALVLPARHPSL